VSSLLRQVIAELITFQVKDPRVIGLVVTDVEVTGDLREAKVYVSGLPAGDDRVRALRALKRASGYLRREIGNRIRLRVTPELHFVHDESLEYGARIEARLLELGLGGAPADEAVDDDVVDADTDLGSPAEADTDLGSPAEADPDLGSPAEADEEDDGASS
jgi:ribosome-binding factor A